MPVVHKTIRVDLPNRLPFDTEFDLEAFAGEYVLPIERKLKRFWFSKYGNVGRRHILFRFSTAQFEQLGPYFDKIRATFGGVGCENYDYIGDLGSSRFIGSNARDQNPVKRANIVYAFLTTSAKLLLGSIVRDANGRWSHETESVSGLNNHTSIESVHHLFCNMTSVPTYAVLFSPPGADQIVKSDMYARDIIRANPQLPYRPFRIFH